MFWHRPTTWDLIKMLLTMTWWALTEPFITVKRCGCGKRYTVSKWHALPYKGSQCTEDEEGIYWLELRNCACGSTIGIETKHRRHA